MNSHTAFLPALEQARKEAYATLNEDLSTVTFYYDDQKANRSGVVDICDHVDSNAYSTATTAVFDASFASYLPDSTAYWFIYCTRLTSIAGIENLNTENVTDMKWMFAYCSALTSLDLSGFNTENMTDASGMFWNCAALKSLDLSRFNTRKVTNMQFMFAGCSALTSLQLSGFNTKNVTNMQCMFNECYSLERLELGNFNTEQVTDMNKMFNHCAALTCLDLSNFNTKNVSWMEMMFYGCCRLKTIYADEEKWSTARVVEPSGSYMLDGCDCLVGGNGTTHDRLHINHEYARIDKPGQPGWLTQKRMT